MASFSIVIQGKANQISIDHIREYQKFGKVILSCYAEDDLSGFYIPDDVTIVRGIFPTTNVFNGTNLYRQVFTTLNGVQASRSDFTIKVRSDERYGNLEPFLKTLIENPFKYVTNNIYFKGTPEPLHPSDHMIGMNTYFFLGALSEVRDICHKYPSNWHHLQGWQFGVDWLNTFTPEVALFLGFLKFVGLLPKDLEEANIRTFQRAALVNIDEMKPYLWTCSVDGQRMFHDTSDDLYHTYPSLKSMDEFWTVRY